MQVPRAAHTATRLTNGRVLLAGGCARRGCEGNATAIEAEIFDPTSQTFSSGPAMTTPRAGHTATLLDDGRVLLIGGYPGEGMGPTATAELYDPEAGVFRPTAVMAQPRGSHTATLLDDGRVLVAGGVDDANRVLDSVEIYDGTTGMFSAGEPLPYQIATHSSVRLNDGRVLVTGGHQRPGGPVTGRVAGYDPETGTWSLLPDLQEARYKHAVVPLADGGALVIGGANEDDSAGTLASIERWDPASRGWVVVARMAKSRFKIPDAVAILTDGRVLIAGDGTSAELFDPADDTVSTVPGFASATMFATATRLDDGRVLIAGGYDEAIDVKPHVYLYNP